MNRLYKIYFGDNNNKYYVKAVTFGGDPFVQIIPAFFDEEIGIFEEDKAKKYVELLNKQTPGEEILFGIEEVEQC